MSAQTDVSISQAAVNAISELQRQDLEWAITIQTNLLGDEVAHPIIAAVILYVIMGYSAPRWESCVFWDRVVFSQSLASERDQVTRWVMWLRNLFEMFSEKEPFRMPADRDLARVLYEVCRERLTLGSGGAVERTLFRYTGWQLGLSRTAMP